MPDEWRATCVRATSLAAVTAVVALGRVIATRAVDARQRSIPDDEDARASGRWRARESESEMRGRHGSEATTRARPRARGYAAAGASALS